MAGCRRRATEPVTRIRTTDGGRPRRGWCGRGRGFAQLTVAGRDDGAVGEGFAQLTVIVLGIVGGSCDSFIKNACLCPSGVGQSLDKPYPF